MERLKEGISSRTEQWWTVIEYASEQNEVEKTKDERYVWNILRIEASAITETQS